MTRHSEMVKHLIEDDATLVGVVSIYDQARQIKALPPELPPNRRARETCETHIADGGDAVLQDKLLSQNLGHGDIVTQISCAGLGCVAKFLKKECPLTVTQYDDEGNVVSEVRPTHEGK